MPELLDGDKWSFGLISMRERAALVGGTFEVRHRSPHGTEVLVTLPDRERTSRT
jgi:signal transduction histidine kinase